MQTTQLQEEGIMSVGGCLYSGVCFEKGST